MSSTRDSCIHLTADIVNEIHAAVLSEFGEALMFDVAASRLDREGTTKRFKALLKRKRAKR